MAYSNENLSLLAYSNSFTLWHYKSEDLSTEIIADSYFDDANKMLRVGDMILINANIDEDMTNDFIVVTSNSNGIIKTSSLINK